MKCRALDMDPWGADRVTDMRPTQDSPGPLRDSPRETHRAGAPDDELGTAVVEHERRRHHAREPVARRLLMRPDHVELAEHVVELRAAPEHPGAAYPLNPIKFV